MIRVESGEQENLGNPRGPITSQDIPDIPDIPRVSEPQDTHHLQSKRGVILIGQLLSPENGGYLLSHKRSTIGAVGLNFSVRNGKRWNPDTITT